MRFRESTRLRGVFFVLLAIAVLVVGRLGQLQVVRAAGADGRKLPLRTRALPAPRGEILDRNGDRLAFDRPIYDVRVEVRNFPGLPVGRGEVDLTRVRAAGRKLVADLLWALARDQDRFGSAAQRDALRARLDTRIVRALERAMARRLDSFDVLVERSLDDAAAIEALRALDVRAAAGADAGGRSGSLLYFHLMPRFERVYAEPERAVGVVGSLRAEPVTRTGPDGRVVVVADRRAVSGLERLAVLEPNAAGREALLVDADSRVLWTNRRVEPEPGAKVYTTLDRALQVRADIEIELAADGVTVHYDSPPEWGALVLVDVRDGGILAAASYTAAKDGTRDRYGAFAPTQCLFAPGSVVKPLHIAMGLERGLIGWNESVDCRPGYRAGSEQAAQKGWRLPGRLIRDSHPNGLLTPPEVLIRSSNIGALRLGLRLGLEGIEDYLNVYAFGTSTGVRLPGERSGERPLSIPSLSRNKQWVFSGPSVLFGYEIQVSALQVARAFLTFLSGRPRSLHVVRAAESGGERVEVPAEPTGERFLSPATIDLVKDALARVVEDEHGTARRVGTWLRGLRAKGDPHLEIAGKTGTSQYRGRTFRWDGVPFLGDIRTASFVGFTPVREPRYLVVCVLQKAGAGSFYGGTYAAPAASRLLVNALERERAESTVSTGRSGLVGVGAARSQGAPSNR